MFEKKYVRFTDNITLYIESRSTAQDRPRK